MKDTFIKYEVRAFVSGEGWKVIDIPESAVTRMDHIRLANCLNREGIQATVHTIITTVETRLIYQNWPEHES